jgi:adenine/guanine phosphoribosyltransferase-like PRPP-binding protein
MKRTPLDLKTGYMYRAFDAADQIAEDMTNTLEAYEAGEYDTLVGTGLSGSLIIPRLAERLDKRWLIVRKAGDGSHSRKPAEGSLGERWLFVDDCIDSGATWERVRHVVRDIVREYDHETEHVGAYLYQGDYFEHPPGETMPEQKLDSVRRLDLQSAPVFNFNESWVELASRYSLRSVVQDSIVFELEPVGTDVDKDEIAEVD